MKYNFSYEFSPEDIIAFRKHYFFDDRGRFILLILTGFITLLLGLDVVSDLINSKKIFPYKFFNILPLIGVILFYQTFSKKPFLKDGLISATFHQKNIELTQEHYICRCDCAEQKFPWKKFIFYEENEDYFFLYYNSKCALLLPKKKAKPQNEFFEALDFIRSKVGTKLLVTQSIQPKKSLWPRNCFLVLIILPLLATLIYYILMPNA